MKATEFCYWLQGMFELGDVKTLNEDQTEKVKNHLNMVFFHDIDKTYPQGTELQKLHDGTTIPSIHTKLRC